MANNNSQFRSLFDGLTNQEIMNRYIGFNYDLQKSKRMYIYTKIITKGTTFDIKYLLLIQKFLQTYPPENIKEEIGYIDVITELIKKKDSRYGLRVKSSRRRSSSSGNNNGRNSGNNNGRNNGRKGSSKKKAKSAARAANSAPRGSSAMNTSNNFDFGSLKMRN